LLKRTEVKEELRRVKREGVLNTQLLVVRLSPHSSSLKCVKGKVYNENI